MNFRVLQNKTDLNQTDNKNISIIIAPSKLNSTKTNSTKANSRKTNLTKINLSSTPNIPTITQTPTLVNTPTIQPTIKNSTIFNNQRTLAVTHNNVKVFEVSFSYLIGYNMLIILLFTIMSIYIKCLRRKNKELSDTIKNNVVLPFHHSPGSSSPGRHFFALDRN
jgi:uncharacterized Fe-S radical SAM superfamily protein PflX